MCVYHIRNQVKTGMKIVFLKISKIGLFIVFLCLTQILIPAVSPCKAREQESMGQLKLEGGSVRQLTLRRKDGQTEKFNQPEQIISLPLGEYQLQQVDLVDGYKCRVLRFPKHDWIKVTEDKPAVLKVGAPLKQTVEVKRQGRMLVLNYKLFGIGGENYTGGNREKPPSFSVYKGDQILDSGQFQYG